MALHQAESGAPFAKKKLLGKPRLEKGRLQNKKWLKVQIQGLLLAQKIALS